MAITKWLTMGLYEAVIFGRTDHFEFGYLNPIIFYRSIEQQSGSYDNALAGIDFKANVAKKFQFYNQIVIDEFVLEEVKKNSGWWANKWAIQLGAKYIDAFNIKNLDLQVEHNRVRPFTYSHRDSVANLLTITNLWHIRWVPTLASGSVLPGISLHLNGCSM
jgi:hypothetical protein